MKKITLEDNGQDFLEFIVDEFGIILEARPFQTEVWKGGFIPVDQQELNSECMLHHLPHFDHGYLKHKVIAIEDYNPETK